jgi:putative spermidine/putrescine transport system permease protein
MLGKATAVGGRLISHTASRRLLNAYSIGVIVVLLMPILAFVPMSFASTAYLSFPPVGFSLRWFQEFFESPQWTAATLRSFGVGIVSATLAVTLGMLAAIGLVRGRSKAASTVFMMFLAPMIVPQIALSVAMFYLFADIGLVATDVGIVIGHCVISLPIVFVILLASFKGYDWRLNDVAMTLGASRLQTIVKIAAPLLKGGLMAGFITGFLHSFEELTVALFLGGGLRSTLPRQMWDSILLQATPLIAAASVIVLAIVIAMYVAAELFQGRRTALRLAKRRD